MPHNCSRCGATCAGIPSVRPAPDPEIEALLRTNLPPSEAQEAFFRETRRTGKPRLAELEMRIADAQAKLDVLLQERDSLVWNLQRCTDVLNPVRRLPSDVLCEIFAHSMTGGKNSYSIYPFSGAGTRRKYSIPCQWRLGMVCMNWRHTVLNYPWLWSMIDLTFQLPSQYGNVRANLPTDNHPYLEAGRKLAMHMYRSANHPLRVRLHGPIPQSLLHILISASYRWEHLCLDYYSLKTVDSPLDALVSFQYILDERSDRETIYGQLPLLRNVTSLSRLIVDKIYPIVRPGLVIIPWTQICSVVVTESFPDTDAIALIQLAPKLDTVEFLNVNHSPLDPSRPKPDSAHSISLKSFSLNVKLPDTVHGASTNYPSTVTVLFDSLTLPALEHFRIDFGGACGLSESITRLLRRSQCVLKRLALIGASTDDSEELIGADEFQNLEEFLIEKLENAAHLQSVLELLTESAGLPRLRTVEIDASAIVDSIGTCQDAVIQFMESRQVTNEGCGRLESLTLRTPADFEISEVNIQRLEALRSLGTRFYIYRH
ncbi:hypothetical protein ARMSODRAFT_444836 [Armillaria solidipes]|uniref:F-box domain-containing protein n=1 Tax=Armillaria solidipes TaxID=1076256 RepID=A0A2H3B2Q0_9AGAR|nr:hypothetical protein ARMSODRAFT_444836 [Armillaria solidipes]